MIKIVITGPESSGKTKLVQQLSNYFQTPWVPEFARQFIDNLERPYRFDDLVDIAKGQLEGEALYEKQNSQILFFDTDLITIKIWSEVKYGKVDPQILDEIRNRHYDFYLLCRPDLPWEFDPQRESPNQLQQLFFLFKKELILLRKPFFEVSGIGEERLKNAIEAVQKFQKKIPTLK